MFITNLLGWVLRFELEAVTIDITVWLPCWMFEQPLLLILFLWQNLSIFLSFLSMVLKCLASLLILMELLHSSIASSSTHLFGSILHVYLW